MNSSGVVLDGALSETFRDVDHAAQDGVALVVEIADEKFVLKNRLSLQAGDQFLSGLQAALVKASPSIILLRYDQKWVIVAWTPDDAPVSLRMLYASSRGSLKSALGAERFTADWQLSCIADCTFTAFKNRLHENMPSKALLTRDEKEADAAMRESQPTAVRMSALPAVAMEGCANVVDAINQFRDGKIDAVVVALDKDQESFVVHFTKPCKCSTNDISRGLPAAEPRFILLKVKTETGLIHYCPESSDRRLKMAYSTFKRNLTEMLTAQNVSVAHSIQLSSAVELNDAEVASRIAPLKTDSDVQFAKPSRPGKGKARLTTN